MTAAPVPEHVGIILDGNRRWAKKQGLEIMFGHQRGADNIERVGNHAIARGVRHFTIYAFSIENWKRTNEVSHLMRIFEQFAKDKKRWAIDKNIRIRVMGQFNQLPVSLQSALTELIKATKSFNALTFNVCLSYGGRDEIIRAAQAVVSAGESINEETLAAHLDSAGSPDPDLIIRTAGEQRLSNFLTWQSAYSELYFTPTYWPDFDEIELDRAIAWYQKRERRYGT